jgi:hypothetical protein
VKVCTEKLAKVQQVGTWAFGIIGVRTDDPQAKIDVSKLTYSTTSVSGNNAKLLVSGPIHYSIPSSLGISKDATYKDTWPMVLENEKWKWCGEVFGRLNS